MVEEVWKDVNKIRNTMMSNEEYKDKCDGCPYNNTECPGGLWCDKQDE